MLIITVLILVIIASLVLLGYLLLRHFPELKNIAVDSLIEEKQNEAKAKLLQAKLSRSGRKVTKYFSLTIGAGKGFFSNWFGKIKDWALNLESKYKPPEIKTDDKKLTLEEMLEEAGVLISKGDLMVSEKKLIEIVSLDKKNQQAYKLLGELYFKRRDYDQAEEIFKHLLKLKIVAEKKQGQSGLAALKRAKLEDLEDDFLSSLDIDQEVAVFYDNLGQIYEVTSKDSKALDCYLKAVAISPNNPKYLDKLIELSIKTGDRGLAKSSFNRLKEINPENAKLNSLKEAIEKI